MEFKEIADRVIEDAKGYSKLHDIIIDTDFSALKLGEEVGELFQALLIHQGKSRKVKRVSEEESKEKLAKELADVAGMAMILADTLDIDLEEAFVSKWKDHL
ncbi:MAG: phosphoribosyl-ATP pyrophosphohydrolase [Candidatus Andersenbacteria bacterium]